jgi:hypothetical protein
VTFGPRARGVVVLALTVVLAAPASARATPFADVPPDHWAGEAIQTLAADGVIDGYPDGGFKGDRPISRDEMAAIVARVVAKIDAEGAQTATGADLDTLQTSVRALSDELDVLGVRVTTLEDQAGVRDRRTALAPALSMNATLPAADTSRPHLANPTILTLTADGLIDGYPGGAFAGHRPLTRYEMAAIVARVIATIDAEGAHTASTTDLDTLRKLTGVLAADLGALGVRVAALEVHLAPLDRRRAVAPSIAVDGTPSVPVTSRARLMRPAIRTSMGQWPLTRAEMASIVARVIATIDAEAAQAASKADLDTLQKRTAVLSGKLAALGVRVTALEDEKP